MKFITPVDVSHAVDAAWTDVDLSSHLGGDAGSVAGVVLYIDNASGTAYSVGVRKNGSTDDIRNDVGGADHITAPVGIDSSDIVEIYVEDASEVTVYLLAYVTDSEGSFLTNWTDKTPGTDSSWQDIDISGDTGGDTSVFAFFSAFNVSPGSRSMGVRPNGSTDAVTADDILQNEWTGGGIPVDGSEIFEAWLEDVTSGIDLYLTGWLTDGVTANTNATEYSATSNNTWDSKDVSADLGASDVGGLMIASRGGGSDKTMSVRKPGDSVPGTSGLLQRYYGFAAVDGSDQMEIYTSDSNGVEFYFYAGFAEPAGGGGTTGLSVNLAGSGGLAGRGGLAGIGGGLAGALTAVVLFIDRVELGRYEFWC